MKNVAPLEIFNNLLEINNDRIEIYTTAYNETRIKDLKNFFSRSIQNSSICKNELLKELKKLNGQTDENASVSGEFFSIWMEINCPLSTFGPKKILEFCENGEDVVQNAYENALSHYNSNKISLSQKKILNEQKSLMISDRRVINNLKASLA